MPFRWIRKLWLDLWNRIIVSCATGVFAFVERLIFAFEINRSLFFSPSPLPVFLLLAVFCNRSLLSALYPMQAF